MKSWLDALDRSRWDWSIRAMEQLRMELSGFEESTGHADLAHVMVAGDSQAGKTTLLLRLLGVTDHEAAREVGLLLRAGRDRGRSATAAPIRYGWSGDEERWSLTHGMERTREWLTSDELQRRLIDLRTGEGELLRWNAADRPLEIGLPERFADPENRRDLRVFDLPGLHAASPQEQEIARMLFAAYTPVMNFVIFVQTADHFAESLLDPAITENAFLADWATHPERFRLVLTRAFSDGSVQDYLTDEPRSWQAEAVAGDCRSFFDAQPGLHTGHPEMIFPVELGDSWRELCESKPEYAAKIQPANELLLTELGDAIAIQSDDEQRHLAAPEIATRVEIAVRHNAKRRARRIADAETRAEAASGATATGRALLARARKQLAVSGELAERLESHFGDLRDLPIPYQRPGEPQMKGPDVRAKQEEEREAWARAARTAWAHWRVSTGCQDFPTLPPSDLAAGVRQEYDRLCDCCERCTESAWSRFWREYEAPDHCYRRMTNVEAGLREWIRAKLGNHAAPAVVKARDRERKAHAQMRLAEGNAARLAAEEKSALAILEEERAAAAGESAKDADYLAIARAVGTFHNTENERHVRRLFAQAEGTGGAARAALVLAAMRCLHDLDRMFKR